jgi:hypothetical protein
MTWAGRGNLYVSGQIASAGNFLVFDDARRPASQ